MPPVLGPLSPSWIRLKSWAGCSGVQAPSAVQVEREDRDLRAVEELLDHDPAARGGMGDRRVTVVGHHDALAGGQAVVLHDVRRAEGVERGLGLVAGLAHRARAVGTPAAAITSFANALEPSSWAASRVGPKRRCPARGRRRRPRPPAAPPGRRRPGRRQPLGQRGDVVTVDSGSTSCSVATPASPGLPGATWTSVTPGSRESARASACSRPPVPITRVLTGGQPRRDAACA